MNMRSVAFGSSIVAIVALIIGATLGAWYERRIVVRVVAEQNAVIAALKNENTLMGEQLARATTTEQIPTAALQPTGGTPAALPPAIISAALPGKGERLCRNTTITLAWRADAARVDQIRISIPNAPAPIAPLADTPVSWNETGEPDTGSVEWRVGIGSFGFPMGPGQTPPPTIDLPDGELYYMRLEALKASRVVETKTTGPFSIVTCEG